MIQPWHLVFIIAGYLLGAVPFGLLLGLARGIDVRQVGSGNTGATNVLRTLGWRAAAVVFLADLAKAAIPVVAARYLVGIPLVEVATGIAAVVGHNWSIYLRGRGGRGVSSAFGVILVTSPLVGLVSLVAFVVLVAATKYVSLGSIIGAVLGAALLIAHVVAEQLTPIGSVSVFGAPSPFHIAFALTVAPIIVFQHRDNIRRLLTGTERKLGQRVS
ncbi:MAG: glycerol-3-phosphate 1-O-acyltransferase PlsY [Chloroflexi bacterium]|nr:glycerol-3-phosphate 1-O-acyltransferase PlsY [Chloroflexota bacterium]